MEQHTCDQRQTSEVGWTGTRVLMVRISPEDDNVQRTCGDSLITFGRKKKLPLSEVNPWFASKKSPWAILWSMSDKGTLFPLKSPFCIWELVWLWKCSPSWTLLTIRFAEHELHFLKYYYVHTLSCVGICVHECVSMWDQRSVSGVFLNCSPLYFLR